MIGIHGWHATPAHFDDRVSDVLRAPLAHFDDCVSDVLRASLALFID